MDGLRITSVDLYADGVVLHSHHASRWADGPATPRLWSDVERQTTGLRDLGPNSLTDDVGSRYFGGGGPYFGINGGGWWVRFAASAFGPAVQSHARRLHIPLRDGGIQIDLDL